MITITKETIKDYENSFHTEYIVTADYGFEQDVIDKHLALAAEECRLVLRKITKGE